MTEIDVSIELESVFDPVKREWQNTDGKVKIKSDGNHFFIIEYIDDKQPIEIDGIKFAIHAETLCKALNMLMDKK